MPRKAPSPKATPPKAKRAPKAPVKPAKATPAPKAVAPKGPSPREAELLVAVEAMKGQLAKLQAAAGKAKGDTRTPEEILTGITASAKDWRTAFHGFCAEGHRCTIARHETGKDGELEIFPELPPVTHCILAIPRDNDVGGKGAQHRALGQIAIHWEPSEDRKAYLGKPAYLSEDELGLVLDEDSWT